jgi:hypothetical protein
MKVDAKIVPGKEKTGLFSSKNTHDLQYTIHLTDVEKAVIIKHGLKDWVILENSTPGYVDQVLWPWLEHNHFDHNFYRCDTLAEAQVKLQQLKKNLTELKQAIDNVQEAPTEDSFEL